MREACRFCGCVTMHASNCPVELTSRFDPVSCEYRRKVERIGRETIVTYEFIPGTMRFENRTSDDR